MNIERIRLDNYQDIYSNITSDESIISTFIAPYTKNLLEAKSLVEELILRYQEPDFNMWGINVSNEVVGIIIATGKTEVEIGYAVGKKYQNKGYATLGLTMACDYLFSKGTNSIIAGVFEDNIPSIKVLDKANFVFKRLEKNAIFYQNKSRNIAYYIKKKG